MTWLVKFKIKNIKTLNITECHMKNNQQLKGNKTILSSFIDMVRPKVTQIDNVYILNVC